MKNMIGSKKSMKQVDSSKLQQAFPDQQQAQQQAQQQPQQQSYGGYGGYSQQSRGAPSAGSGVYAVKHPLSKAKPTDDLIAVIVTICGGNSYDDMFKQVPQDGPEGTRIATYGVQPEALSALLVELEKTPGKGANQVVNDDQKQAVDQAVPPGGAAFPAPEAEAVPAAAASRSPMEQLCSDIAEVDRDSVVFNWECCSGCSDHGFSMNGKAVLGLMEVLVERGHMVMCSDFSLKALIKEWNPKNAPKLGPNPFVQLGEFSDSMEIAFDPEVLAECPSTQLQKVGDLCKDKGTADVHALGGTIVYTVDKAKADNSAYKLEVLSVVPRCGSFAQGSLQPAYVHKIKGHSGVTGHVLLRYPSGGKILTSAGHWIELVKLDVSEATLLRVAETEYGAEYVNQMKQEMDQCTDAVSRKQKVQSRACQMVQSSAPMEYSKGYGRSKAGYKGKWSKS